MFVAGMRDPCWLSLKAGPSQKRTIPVRRQAQGLVLLIFAGQAWGRGAGNESRSSKANIGLYDWPRVPTKKRRTAREDKNMKKVMTAAFALSALFATSGKVHADVNYPWCIIGDTRAVDCYFTREQCAQDGRNRGFGGQCIKNPFYKPAKPTVSDKKGTVSQTARPSQQGVSAAHSTCTGLKPQCFSDCGLRGTDPKYCEYRCNFEWERCMKSGFWEGVFQHRPAERR
jgi:hypothetical protein